MYLLVSKLILVYLKLHSNSNFNEADATLSWYHMEKLWKKKILVGSKHPIAVHKQYFVFFNSWEVGILKKKVIIII